MCVIIIILDYTKSIGLPVMPHTFVTVSNTMLETSYTTPPACNIRLVTHTVSPSKLMSTYKWHDITQLLNNTNHSTSH